MDIRITKMAGDDYKAEIPTTTFVEETWTLADASARKEVLEDKKANAEAMIESIDLELDKINSLIALMNG